jgi:hypothetical protein
VAGAAVQFTASSGSLLGTSAVTGLDGIAETWLRLPAQETVTPGQCRRAGVASAPVTFAVRSTAVIAGKLPKLQQAGSTVIGNGTATIAQRGSLLTAVASILRYHQNPQRAAGPNGTADPVALNAFLKSYCPPDASGKANCDGFLTNPDSGEQVVNLVAGGRVHGRAPMSRSLLPPLRQLGMWRRAVRPCWFRSRSRVMATGGGHFVVATGIAADGSIAIQDPSPVFARGNLKDYLGGFSVNGETWKGEVRGVVHFALGSPAATRFLTAAVSQPTALLDAMSLDVSSAAGSCGNHTGPAGRDRPCGASGAIRVTRLLALRWRTVRVSAQGRDRQPFQALVDDLASGGAMTDVSGSQTASYKMYASEIEPHGGAAGRGYPGERRSRRGHIYRGDCARRGGLHLRQRTVRSGQDDDGGSGRNTDAGAFCPRRSKSMRKCRRTRRQERTRCACSRPMGPRNNK